MAETLEVLLNCDLSSMTLAQRVTVADQLIEFLDRELERLPFEQNLDLQILILERLTLLGHPELKPLLVVFSQQHVDAKMKEKAKQLLDRVLCDIDRLFDETVVDQIATSNQRCQSLSNLVERRAGGDFELVYSSEDSRIRALFAALKGLSINTAERELMDCVGTLVHHSSERFKLSVCLAFVEMCLYDDPAGQLENHAGVFKSVIDGLASLALESSNVSHSCYAVELLNRLSKRDKKLEVMILHAKEQASRRFLDKKGKHYKI